MMYAAISNGTAVVQYPVDLRTAFPNTLFPAVINVECLPDGIVPVLPTMPIKGMLQVAEEITPVFEDGSWKQAWSVADMPAEEAAAVLSAERARLCDLVDQSRDAKIDGGFTHAGHVFQSRPSDRENVAGAAQAAFMAKAAGAQTGDYRWADPDNDFVWITAGNQLVPMDVNDVIGLFKAGVAFKSALTFYGRGLKDAINESVDPQAVFDAANWPV